MRIIDLLIFLKPKREILTSIFEISPYGEKIDAKFNIALYLQNAKI